MELYNSSKYMRYLIHLFHDGPLIAKRRNSSYEARRRSGAWVKVKLIQQQEFVIGGYTPPVGTRKYFGALLVGYYGEEGLLFAAPRTKWMRKGVANAPHQTLLPKAGFQSVTGKEIAKIKSGKTDPTNSTQTGCVRAPGAKSPARYE